jgi:hypothetical protein
VLRLLGLLRRRWFRRFVVLLLGGLAHGSRLFAVRIVARVDLAGSIDVDGIPLARIGPARHAGVDLGDVVAVRSELREVNEQAVVAGPLLRRV